MTEQELLKLTGDELSMALGEVLRGDMRANHDEDSSGRCKKCLCKFTDPSWRRECIAVPILLTPDNAFKWRDWAVDKLDKCEYVKALLAVFGVAWNPVDIDFTVVCGLFGCELKPEHYLKAAALCEIRSKK